MLTLKDRAKKVNRRQLPLALLAIERNPQTVFSTYTRITYLAA